MKKIFLLSLFLASPLVALQPIQSSELNLQAYSARETNSHPSFWQQHKKKIIFAGFVILAAGYAGRKLCASKTNILKNIRSAIDSGAITINSSPRADLASILNPIGKPDEPTTFGQLATIAIHNRCDDSGFQFILTQLLNRILETATPAQLNALSGSYKTIKMGPTQFGQLQISQQNKRPNPTILKALLIPLATRLGSSDTYDILFMAQNYVVPRAIAIAHKLITHGATCTTIQSNCRESYEIDILLQTIHRNLERLLTLPPYKLISTQRCQTAKTAIEELQQLVVARRQIRQTPTIAAILLKIRLPFGPVTKIIECYSGLRYQPE